MADDVPSQFPATAIDSFTTLTDNTDTVIANHPNSRASSIVAVQTKVGKNGDSNINSHDYLLTHLPAQAGNWDAGGYEIRAETFESDVATGTAPLTVASTTVCTNLNADTVDGKHVAGTNGAGEITTNDGSQTLTNKTLTSPDINGGTVDGVTIGASSAPTVTNLGAVATCDINGGTIDGVTIGASDAPTVTNLGSVATCDINGGTVNGISSLSCSAGASINEISTDGTMAGNSDTAVPTEKAVKTYVDASTSFFYSGQSVYNTNAPTSYTDLDLSANIGSNRALVFLKVKNNGDNTNYDFSFRTNGDSETVGDETSQTYLGGGSSAATIRAGNIAYITVMTDSAGIIEWKSRQNHSTAITLLCFIK